MRNRSTTISIMPALSSTPPRVLCMLSSRLEKVIRMVARALGALRIFNQIIRCG